MVDALRATGVEPQLFVPKGSQAHHENVRIAGTYDRWTWSTLGRLHQVLQETGAEWLHVQHQVSMYRSHLAAYAIPRYLRWKRWPGRIAATFHDIAPPRLFPRGQRLWHWFARDWILADLARNVDIAIAADTTDVASLSRFGANVRHVPIGSNIAAYQADAVSAAELRRRHGIPAGTLAIGHFGTPIGLETLLAALQQIRNAVVLLVGKKAALENKANVEKLTSPLLEKIEQLAVADRLRWTGRLSEADAAATLSACDVLVLPYAAGASLRHGGLMAAITQGKAVITSSPREPMPGLTDRDAVLTFPCGDPNALAAAVTRVADDAGLRTRLEQNAALAARTVFSWEAIAREHLKIYLSSPAMT